jgi:hypothetical protein
MMRQDCQKCGKVQKKLCHINVLFRSPRKVYKGSKRPFIRTENRALCYRCFSKMEREIKNIIK